MLLLLLIIVVLGSVYQAAALSKLFRVKKFIIKEASTYPIQVNFNFWQPFYQLWTHM